MDNRIMTVKKNTGEIEQFSTQKLEKSLMKSGATKQEVQTIIKIISPMIYNGISSDVIYGKAYFLLKNSIKFQLQNTA